MSNTGEIIGNIQRESVLECKIKWTVEKFLNRPTDHLQYLLSPFFQMNFQPEVEWQMCLNPHNYYINQKNTRKDCVGLYIDAHCEEGYPSFKLEACEFSILTRDGSEVEMKHVSSRCVVTGYDNHFGMPNFIGWKILLERQKSLVPDGNLTVVCRVQTIFNESSVIQNTRLSSKESLKSTTSDLPKKKGKQKCLRSEVVKSDSILNTKKELLERGLCADVVLKCSGQSFKCHRNILAARSEVFEKMFHGDLKQTVIDLGEDITPGAMEDLLSFIYTGQTKNLKTNSFLLFIVAGEYGLAELKVMAEKEIIKKLNPDSAIDLLVFAQKTGAKELRKLAAECIAQSE